MKKLLFTLFAIFSLFLVGCEKQTIETKTQDNKPNQETLVTEKGKFTVDFKTNPTEVKAGENTNLMFTVKNDKGETVKDLQTVHEKPIHLLVVSDDLDEFYHLHPEVQADGIYKVSFDFPNGGNYKLYADFTPLDSAQVVQNFPLKVSGTERAKVALTADEKFEKTIDGLRVTMKPDAELASNKELLLDFQVSDAATNKPATDLQPYLGALAHFVVISQDLQEFVHAHPLSKDGMKEGEHSHDKMDEHQPNEKTMSGDATATVSAHVTFPKAAIYKIFAQFQRNGKVITVPFIVNVKQGKVIVQ